MSLSMGSFQEMKPAEELNGNENGSNFSSLPLSTLHNFVESAPKGQGDISLEETGRSPLFKPKLSSNSSSKVWAKTSFSNRLVAILPRYMRRGGLRPSKKLHPTSYLDALRGLAALVVVNYHWILEYEGFGVKGAWLVEQPFLRPLLCGPGMVDVFFVISGYVLSYRLLKLIRNRQSSALLDALSSATFRRYLRLYLSCAFATLCSALLIYFHLIKKSSVRQDSFFHQLQHWARDMTNFCNPFTEVNGFYSSGNVRTHYNSVMWTIPVEFRGSLILFGFCLAACKLSTPHRMVFCWVIILLAYYWKATFAALFLIGLYIADLSFSRHPERYQSATIIPNPKKNVDLITPSITKRLFYWGVLCFAILLLSQPVNRHDPTYWPWPILKALIPSHYFGTGVSWHFWLSIGASLLVWVLDIYPVLQTPLKWEFPQYLGEVSFGIYVCHMQVFDSLYTWVLLPIRVNYLGNSLFACASTTVVTYMAVLWAADLFTRVDAKTVYIGKLLEKRLFTF